MSFEGTDLPRAVVTGNPLRAEIRAVEGPAQRTQARAELGLPVDRTVVAVFSGSLGSRRINDAVRGGARRWSERQDLAIRHVVGTRDFETFVADAPRPPDPGLVYQVIRYEERMDLLLAAADLAVTRAGGGVAELAAVGLPAILVPLPIATRDHQTGNARVLTDAGAAVLIPDDECTTERLSAEVEALLARSDPTRGDGPGHGRSGAARRRRRRGRPGRGARS